MPQECLGIGNGVDEVLPDERFRNVEIHLVGEVVLPVPRHRVRREGDDDGLHEFGVLRAVEFSDHLGRHDAVHAGHLRIMVSIMYAENGRLGSRLRLPIGGRLLWLTWMSRKIMSYGLLLRSAVVTCSTASRPSTAVSDSIDSRLRNFVATMMLILLSSTVSTLSARFSSRSSLLGRVGPSDVPVFTLTESGELDWPDDGLRR